ncbi:4'-phosphopantetheinyl transferase family protein [Massilia endophytica]|uniref:4'-phosphopantetheinyl transferase family protein n=1 Tax=Massilia endophytica TaxID=2899220 RepID=UPI001E3274B7|nr:4'-phosphopantetheinyl transferase superfamily protein [Massilia endophytica]UGQ48630.1 4'-phosphopantetheinyl transferase superfamily protein [Massilia endophytica]
MLRPHSFIGWDFHTFPGRIPFPFVLARYELAHFEPGLFREFGIDAPATIGSAVRKRQAEFLAGRICAREALRLHGAADAQVAVGSHRAPRWPQGVAGSITHNGSFAAAAVFAQDAAQGVGIDIESRIGEALHGEIAREVAHEGELALLDGEDLALLFSAKESFFKAAFGQVGEFFGFEAVELVEFDAASARLQFRCVQALSPALQPGFRFDAFYQRLDEATVMTAVVLP